MLRSGLIRFIVLFVFASPCIPFETANAGVLWANPWIYQDPMELSFQSNVGVAYTAEGGAILSAMSSSGLNFQAMRIDSAGTLQWAANLYGYRSGFDQGMGAIIDLEDGGAIVSLQDEAFYLSGEISRLDASGQILWSRQTSTNWLTRAGADRIAYGACNILTVADIHTGDVIWQRAFGAMSTCSAVSGAIDGSGNVYASFAINVGGTTTGYRFVKFSPDGSEAWNVVKSASGGGAIVGTNGSTVFVKTATELLALQSAGGTEVWSAPISAGSRVVLTEDAPIEPIVLGSSTTYRLNGDTGSERWSTAAIYCNYCSFPFISPGSMLFFSGGLARFDTTTGNAVWSVPLAGETEDGQSINWVNFGGLSNGQILGIAREGSAGAPAYLRKFDFNTGASMAVVPTVPIDHGVNGGISKLDGNDVFDFAFGPDQTAQRIRVRRTDLTTGVVAWENAEARLPEEFNDFGFELAWLPADVGVGSDTVATATSWQSYGQTGPYGLAFVSLHERSNGSQRWSVTLWEPDQGQTYASEPLFDDAGNVFVQIGTTLPCAFNSRCAHRFLYKLAATSGEILWRVDSGMLEPEEIRGGSFAQVFPSSFDIFDGDIVMAGPFPGTTHSLVRLSGSDGSVIWSSDLFYDNSYGPGFYRQDDGHIIAYSYPQQGRVDVTTGSVVWTTSVSYPGCTNTCYEYDNLVMPGGDLLSVGEGDSRPRIIRTHNDGSGSSESWSLEPNSPSLRSVALDVEASPSGKTMIGLIRRHRRAPGSLTVLVGFDSETGAMTSQQVISNAAIDATSENIGKPMLALPGENRMLFEAFDVGENRPFSFGSGLLDTTITAHGDLTLTATTGRRHVRAGETLEFSVVVTYSGDQPISGVTLNVGPYIWRGGIANVVCSVQSASNCVVDGRSGTVAATFDMQPGGNVEITGQLQVVENYETDYFGGAVSGPVGLSEVDTVNNFSRAQVVQGLFGDGFESFGN